MISGRVAIFGASLITMTGCAAGTPLTESPAAGGTTAQSTGTPAVTTLPSPGAIPTIVAGQPLLNWDRPIPDGIDVAVPSGSRSDSLSTDQRSALANSANTAGHLGFLPIIPKVDAALSLLQVTDPRTFTVGQTAEIVLQFPIGAGFPVDGRVAVAERRAQTSNAELLAMINNPPGNASDFSKVTLSNGQVALQIAANGAARVQFVRDGVQYDVTGPAVSPTAAQDIASHL